MKNLRFLALAASLCALALSFSSCSKDDEPTNVFELPALESTTLEGEYYWSSLDNKARLILDFQRKKLLYVDRTTTDDSYYFVPFDYKVDAKTRELKLIMLDKSAYDAWGSNSEEDEETLKAEKFRMQQTFTKADYEFAQKVISKIKRIELSRGLTEIYCEGWLPCINEGTTDTFILQKQRYEY